MEKATEIKQNSDKLTISPPWMQHSRWIGEQLTVLAEALGEPLTPARLKLYAQDLADLEPEQLACAFAKARRELKFFPKIAELRELAGATRAKQDDAEGRKAWDVVTSFVRKYVSNDVHGNWGPQHGWYSTFPKLSDRILDTVRRTGGWRTYACMTDEDFPFTQKRFFEEYAAWTAVEQVLPTKLLTEMPKLKLVAKPMELIKGEPAPRDARVPSCSIKRVSEPLSEAQVRDRREILRQQAVLLQKRATGEIGSGTSPAGNPGLENRTGN